MEHLKRIRLPPSSSSRAWLPVVILITDFLCKQKLIPALGSLWIITSTRESICGISWNRGIKMRKKSDKVRGLVLIYKLVGTYSEESITSSNITEIL